MKAKVTTASAIKEINIRDFIQSEWALRWDDGERLHPILRTTMLEESAPVVLNFEGISEIIPPFLNAAYGPLLEHHSIDEIKAKIFVEHLSEQGRDMLDYVLQGCKAYFNMSEAQRQEELNILFG